MAQTVDEGAKSGPKAPEALVGNCSCSLQFAVATCCSLLSPLNPPPLVFHGAIQVQANTNENIFVAVCCLHGNVIAKVVADRAKLLLLAASACGIYLSLRNACKISETIGSRRG